MLYYLFSTIKAFIMTCCLKTSFFYVVSNQLSCSLLEKLMILLVFKCCITNYHIFSGGVLCSGLCTAKIKGLSEAIVLSGADNPFQPHSSCWQISFPCGCRTEVPFSFWLSADNHSQGLTTLPLSWAVYNMPFCQFWASRSFCLL